MNVLFLAVALAVSVEAPKVTLHEVAAAAAAVTPATKVAAVPEAPGPSGLREVAIFREPASERGCDPADIYAQRFLSAPWCARRRLNAAKKTGDVREAKRMERKLVETVFEAIDAEED